MHHIFEKHWCVERECIEHPLQESLHHGCTHNTSVKAVITLRCNCLSVSMSATRQWDPFLFISAAQVPGSWYLTQRHSLNIYQMYEDRPNSALDRQTDRHTHTHTHTITVFLWEKLVLALHHYMVPGVKTSFYNMLRRKVS